MIALQTSMELNTNPTNENGPIPSPCKLFQQVAFDVQFSFHRKQVLGRSVLSVENLALCSPLRIERLAASWACRIKVSLFANADCAVSSAHPTARIIKIRSVEKRSIVPYGCVQSLSAHFISHLFFTRTREGSNRTREGRNHDLLPTSVIWVVPVEPALHIRGLHNHLEEPVM